jgi:hypothetical protein
LALSSMCINFTLYVYYTGDQRSSKDPPGRILLSRVQSLVSAMRSDDMSGNYTASSGESLFARASKEFGHRRATGKIKPW